MIRGGAEASSSTGGPIASQQRIRYRSDSYPRVNEQVVAEFLHPNSKKRTGKHPTRLIQTRIVSLHLSIHCEMTMKVCSVPYPTANSVWASIPELGAGLLQFAGESSWPPGTARPPLLQRPYEVIAPCGEAKMTPQQ